MAAFAPRALAGGLSTWSGPHPGWKPENGVPGGWPEIVSSVVVEANGAPLVLVDPLAPQPTDEAAAFWRWLDERRAAHGGLVVLLPNFYHRRSVPEILARWPQTRVHAGAGTASKVTFAVDEVADGEKLAAGVIARAIVGLDIGETAWHVPSAHALVLADAVIGASEGELRVAPASWAASKDRYEEKFLASVRAAFAASAPIVHALVSHGPSVLERGGDALEVALVAPAWGRPL